MNTSTTLTESTRDVMAQAALAGDPDEGWFAPPKKAAPVSTRPPPRMSSRPPPVVALGDFLGDPEVDGWLR